MSATPLLGWDTRMVRHKGTFSRYFIHLPSLSHNSLANGARYFIIQHFINWKSNVSKHLSQSASINPGKYSA